MRFLRLAVLASALALPAAAHQAPSGWEYDPSCCSGTDCAPVPDEAIREAQGGYEVLIQPGTHPMVGEGAEPARRFVPHGDPRIRTSGDERKHACVSRFGAIYCLYVPPSGA